MSTVLVAERSPGLLRLLEKTLPMLFPEWSIIGTTTAKAAEDIQRTQILALILLDTNVASTWQECIGLLRHWRESGVTTPIAATTEERSLAPSLWSVGVDEVLFKPWDTFDLQPRLGRLVRLPAGRRDDHRRPRADGVAVTETFAFGPVIITPDFLGHFPDGAVERLGVKEYGILSVFAGSRGRLILREELLRQVWGGSASTESNSVNVYLSRLRRLFAEHQSDFNGLVTTESKVGWRISQD